MNERTTFEVVWMFMIFPAIAGAALLGFTVVNIKSHGHEFSASDWFWQACYAGGLSFGLFVVLPSAGWLELRRRKRQDCEVTRTPTSE